MVTSAVGRAGISHIRHLTQAVCVCACVRVCVRVRVHDNILCDTGRDELYTRRARDGYIQHMTNDTGREQVIADRDQLQTLHAGNGQMRRGQGAVQGALDP
jgi:hypothetical protein